MTIRLAAGHVLGGDFELIRELGRGGGGAVYLARQLSTDAVRAVKVLGREHHQTPAALERFGREARSGARISSSHVIEVVAAGVDPGLGAPWLAMEYLEGETLRDVHRAKGPPGPTEARALLAQLYHACGAAHHAGIVHRDLKPDNVYLARAQSPTMPFTVKVLDFGIAKWLGDTGATTDGLWTYLWGAPEQFGRGRVGPATDVYSLALLTFWLLTGHSYWRVERGRAAVMAEQLVEPLTPTSARASELQCPWDLGPSADDWFARCLARCPAERFRDASRAFEALLEVALPWSGPPRWFDASSTSLGAFEATLEGSVCAANVARVRQRPHTDGSRRRVANIAIVVSALALLSSAGLAARAHHATPVRRTPVPESDATLPPIPDDMRLVVVDGAGPGEGFLIDTHEVSAGHYSACMLAGACTPSGQRSAAGVPLSTPYDSLCTGRDRSREQHPINCVSFVQARQYCEWVGRRLPTVSEWEVAASGAGRHAFPWGAEPPERCSVAVVSGLCERVPFATRAVGTREATSLSPYGVADLAGNVAEWVEGSNTDAEVGGPQLGLLKGGSWDRPPAEARVQAARGVPAQQADVDTGFRCALSLPIRDHIPRSLAVAD